MKGNEIKNKNVTFLLPTFPDSDACDFGFPDGFPGLLCYYNKSPSLGFFSNNISHSSSKISLINPLI